MKIILAGEYPVSESGGSGRVKELGGGVGWLRSAVW